MFLSLVAVLILFLAAYLGAQAGLQVFFGIIFAYIALILFLTGLVYRVAGWARVPVPFRIPTTSGQEKSLPWIKYSRLDNPSNTTEAVGRMALEVLFFRSLLKNTKTELHDNGHLAYGSSIWLWLGSMAFHYAMLVIVLRHIRLFVEPVPRFVTGLQSVDGFLQIGVPVFYITTFLFIGALSYLLLRRLLDAKLRYISLVNDYFPLFLLLGIGISGFWMRHVSKTDIVGVKELLLRLVSLNPTIPETVEPIFYAHFFLVCMLMAYFPFSKLVHMGGVFLSPTRNLANNNRAVRHINPWDYPVKVHTYEEYEDEFRDKMKAAGLPVDNE